MSDPLVPPAPGGVCVASLAQARKHKRRHDATITLEDPRTRPGDRMRFERTPHPPHLVLAFEDCDDEALGFATATADQVARAIAFGREHASGSLLVHCRHGVGRSAACALAILADRAGPGREADAVAELLRIRPSATPNLVAVAHADAILGRDGALVAALADSEAADPAKIRARRERADFASDPANAQLYTRRT